MNNNILITSAGKRVALVRYFQETLKRFAPHAKVFTTDLCPEMAPAGYVSDHCFSVPRATSADYVEALMGICRENAIGLIVPTIDTELLVLAEAKNDFARQGIHVSVPEASFVRLCRDKRLTVHFFEEKGIAVPRSIDVQHPVFPIFAKPFNGSLSANIHIIRTQEDLTSSILSDGDLMFMEYLAPSEYKEYTVDMYYGKDHLLKCVVPRERIEIRAGEINKGKTCKNTLLPYLKERLSYIDGCEGCICAQFFQSHKTGEIKGIEINPRFGGGYPLSYMAGANYPEYLIREWFLGEVLDYSENWADGKLMLRYDEAVFV